MKKTTKGYTVIEILMAISLLNIVIALAVILLMYYFRSYSFSFTQQQAIHEGQRAFAQIIRDIREIRTGENGSWPIIEALDNSFIFYSDVTNDGRTDRVRYFVEDNQLKKGVIEPSLPPVNYPQEEETVKVIALFINNTASNPIFTYYNGGWPGDMINNPLPPDQRLYNLRLVGVNISINVDSGGQTSAYEINSAVMLKNLKDNL